MLGDKVNEAFIINDSDTLDELIIADTARVEIRAQGIHGNAGCLLQPAGCGAALDGGVDAVLEQQYGAAVFRMTETGIQGIPFGG